MLELNCPAARKRCFRWMVAVLLAGSPLAAHAASPTGPPMLLPDSIKPVSPQTGPLDPHKPAITRSALTDAESAAPREFEVALKMRNFAELKARVARGERVPPGELAARYEPLAADYDAVAAWLAGQGLTVTRRDPHHVAIFARGKISDLQRALDVTFARVSLEGREYTSAITAPSVPAALGPALLGINGLQPHLHAHSHIVRRQAQPDALGGGGSYFPAQIAQAYGATPLYNSNIKGSGEAIAIVIDTFPDPTDLVAYWKAAGINQTIGNIQFIQAVSGTLDSPSGEETLDTEWSSSIAPQARVRVYAALDFVGADLDAAYMQVYEDATEHPELGIHQMSMSYGQGEAYTTDTQMQTDDEFFVELTNQGVTVFASSGDDGSTPGPEGTGDESGPVQVDNPASDPYVVGVGGTTLVLDGNNDAISETVWNENGGASGGGYSSYFPRFGWQTGTGVSTADKRQVPDVACAADPEYGGIIIQGGVEQTVGGTSWASPTWAGFSALINQARAAAGAGPTVNLGMSIYPLLSGTNYPANYKTEFRDITSGNNETRNNGEYPATAGYDLCTGIGTPRVGPLAELLTGSTALVGIQMPAAVQQVAPGQTAAFAVSVTGAAATYQWQRMPVGTDTWSNLTDGGPYGGSTESTLAISGATTAMSGDQFQCLVTIGANTITTAPASVLIVDTLLDVTTLAGQAGVTGLANGNGKAAQFNYPSGVAVDGSGNIYVADFGNNQVRKITPAGAVSTPYGNLAGNSGNNNGSGNNARFNTPNGVAADAAGNLYVVDTGNNIIRKIAGGVVSTLAGTANRFSTPEGLAVDGSGNVYVADTGNDTIREISPGGAVSVFAGQTGNAGYADGAATSEALFNGPSSVAVDSQGDVYVADFGNSVVRKISGGTVSTVAGQADVAGYLDGLGQNALFNAPIGLAVDGSDNLYIADSQVPPQGSTAAGNDVVRRLSPAGVVSTIAGEAGTTGSADGAGTAAQFYSLQALATGSAGLVYLADTYNQTIRAGQDGATEDTTKIISLTGNMEFGDVAVGETGTSTLTIDNGGNTPLTVSGITFPSGFSGDWASGVITAGGSQNIDVTFAPAAAIGYVGNIVVSSDATSGTASITASGNGVTVSPAPAVTTGTATGIAGSSATLNGFVNPNGGSTTVYFNYGTTPSYGSVSASTSAGAGSSLEPIAVTVTGLTPSTLYYYQAVASSNGGTVTGAQETFTTSSYSTIEVAATGDAAPGVTGALYSTFGNPAINNGDGVAFQATLAAGTSVAAFDNTGIWAANGSGTRQLVARASTFAPGTDSAQFLKFSDPVYNNHGAVAFLGTLRVTAGRASAGTAMGIWSNSSGSLGLVARQGSQAAGYPVGVTFKTFNSIALPDQGGVIFDATLSNGAQGIWAGASSASLTLLAQTGGMISAETIAKIAFLPAPPYVNGQSRSFAQGTGDIAYRATFADKTSGIVVVAGSNTLLPAESQEAAPGAPGTEFAAFGYPAINANDYVAFEAKLAGAAAADNGGVWADGTDGVLELVARTGAAAPGTEAVFKALSDPVYNDNEAVAFRGTLKVAGGQATGATATGVWSNSGGALALVARQGGQAPGCPPGATFHAFTSLGLPNQGGVIFLATLNTNAAADVTAANKTGIWAVDANGNLQLIVRTGNIVGGEEIKTLSFLPILLHIGGQSRNFTQATGDVAYLVTFSDKTSAIYVVSFQ